MMLVKIVSNFVTSGHRRMQKPGLWRSHYGDPKCKELHDANCIFTLILILVMSLLAQNWVKILELAG